MAPSSISINLEWLLLKDKRSRNGGEHIFSTILGYHLNEVSLGGGIVSLIYITVAVVFCECEHATMDRLL